MRETLRIMVMVVAATAALQLASCTSCSYNPPFSTVDRGGVVEFDELTVPECDDLDCVLVLDVVNSYQVHVRTIFEGHPSTLVYPVYWDTRDDEGELVPSDVYVLRAKLNGTRVDSWTVIVTEDTTYADTSTDPGGDV